MNRLKSFALVRGGSFAMAACVAMLGAAAASAQSGAAKVPAAAAERSTTATTKPPSATEVPRRRTVIIDAGHGGRDPGMTGMTSARRRLYEKDVVLAVAKQVQARLEAAGVKVVMTRTADTLIALGDRGRIANRENGDLFISVHVNAANPKWKSPGATRGFETYFLAEAKTEDERRVADMENEVSRFDDGGERTSDSAVDFMFNDMLQNQHLRESSELASIMQAGLRGTHPGPSRGVKQAGFRVLVTAYMPAVLVEIGFGTNGPEADWMSSTAGQAEAGLAIADSALEYLARFERRVSGGTSGPGK
ncbi:MAG: N-acetylmuramoyl-L-alanine amidase [Gemmatimonadetes bacterium]|nr:N-acetylmuramoyl-L-alanine amidase [Gemmatimonadota bacterium]